MKKVYCKKCSNYKGMNKDSWNICKADFTMNFIGEIEYTLCLEKNTNCDCLDYKEKYLWIKNIIKRFKKKNIKIEVEPQRRWPNPPPEKPEGEYVIDMLNRAHERKVTKPPFEKWLNDHCLINETEDGTMYIFGCDLPLDDVLLTGFRLKYLEIEGKTDGNKKD